MCTQMRLIWLPVHLRPHTAGSPERLGNDSDSGSQECELCDMQPGSSACMVSVQATTASPGIRGHLALKEGILPHLCSWNNIRSVCWRRTRERQRETRPNRQPCFWLCITHSTHPAFPFMHKSSPAWYSSQRQRPAVEPDGNPFTKMLLKQLEIHDHIICFTELFNCRKASTGAVPMGWQVGTAAVHLDLEEGRARGWTAAGTQQFKERKEQRNSKTGWCRHGQGQVSLGPRGWPRGNSDPLHTPSLGCAGLFGVRLWDSFW